MKQVTYGTFQRSMESRAKRSMLLGGLAPSSTITVAIGQASETDTAQAVAWAPKFRRAAQSSETNTAQALTRRKAKALTQPVETDLAQAVTRRKTVVLGQGVETDTAQAMSGGAVAQPAPVRLRARPHPSIDTRALRSRLLGGLAPSFTITAAIGQASETDVAQPISRAGVTVVRPSLLRAARPADALRRIPETVSRLTGVVPIPAQIITVGQGTETDLAQALTRRKVKALSQATETDVALNVTRRKLRTLGAASETDLAQALTHRKAKGLGQALETDLAQPVSRPGVLAATVNQAVETDLARPIAWAPKRRLVAQASEVDVSQPVTRRKVRTLGIPLEAALALALARQKARSLSQAATVDLAQVVAWAPKQRAVGLAGEIDLAQPIGVQVGEKLRNLVPVTLHVATAVRRTLAVAPTAETVLQVSERVTRTLTI